MIANKIQMSRRQLLKAGLIGGAGMMLPLRFLPAEAFAKKASRGLSNPARQPKFVNLVPDALSPGFIFRPNRRGRYHIEVGRAVQQTGGAEAGS